MRTGRIEVLTGGGDCPGLNAVIRAVAKPLSTFGGDRRGWQPPYIAGILQERDSAGGNTQDHRQRYHGHDITLGFDTALHTATEDIDKLHTTAESHHRMMVAEVMGRNSVWIALQSGIAGGGDLILVPEIPFTFESVVKKIKQRMKSGKRFSIVVVAERTSHPEKGVISKKIGNSTLVLGGVGESVDHEIEERTGMETMVTVLGHLQRCGSPSPFDRVLATRFGVEAVEMVAEGLFGRMHVYARRGYALRNSRKRWVSRRRPPTESWRAMIVRWALPAAKG